MLASHNAKLCTATNEHIWVQAATTTPSKDKCTMLQRSCRLGEALHQVTPASPFAYRSSHEAMPVEFSPSQ